MVQIDFIVASLILLAAAAIAWACWRQYAAQRALRESVERFQLANRATFIAIWDVDLRTNKLWWSDNLQALFGYQAEEIEPGLEFWSTCIHPDDLERVNAGMQAALVSDRESWSDRYRFRRKDGSFAAVEDRGHITRDRDGRAKRMLGAMQDVTEQRRADQEKTRLEGQLRQAQKMESVGRLAGGVAHDFNNMLGVILGNTELAMEKVDPAQPLGADLEEIRQAASRSVDLTRQLLAFARKQTIAPEVLDLNETVAGMLKMLRRLIGEDIDLVWQPGAELWPANVDPSQLDQILANLCVNARHAIAGVGKVTIETRNSTFDGEYCATHAGFVPGEHVQLVVSDDGCGMDKDTLTHIFEPFFTTSTTGNGTGLGLATVYGIVKQNSGFINVYSEPGHGSTFTIYLPRHIGEVGRARREGEAGPALRGHETILLVEDELSILKLARTMLEHQGYTVLAAGTPGEAIRLSSEFAGRVDLLMTDVVMPEMNGRDLARSLVVVHPHLKSLFMSGYTANVIAHHGVLDEGVLFIQKPFSLSDMAASVRKALDRD